MDLNLPYLKVLTWNVGKTNNPQSEQGVIQMQAIMNQFKETYDIIFLQELGSKAAVERTVSYFGEGWEKYSSNIRNSYHNLTLVKKKPGAAFAYDTTDISIASNFRVDPLCINVHGRKNDSTTNLSTLSSLLLKLPFWQPVIIAGDFNCTFSPYTIPIDTGVSLLCGFGETRQPTTTGGNSIDEILYTNHFIATQTIVLNHLPPDGNHYPVSKHLQLKYQPSSMQNIVGALFGKPSIVQPSQPVRHVVPSNNPTVPTSQPIIRPSLHEVPTSTPVTGQVVQPVVPSVVASSQSSTQSSLPVRPVVSSNKPTVPTSQPTVRPSLHVVPTSTPVTGQIVQPVVPSVVPPSQPITRPILPPVVPTRQPNVVVPPASQPIVQPIQSNTQPNTNEQSSDKEENDLVESLQNISISTKPEQSGNETKECQGAKMEVNKELFK
ncbi:hypothetical protein C9374_012318 [Naegleria lovaniensis]|uniref:Endonuclease/exonuclease/phosphatase domain-containing protein n=1 Tax=Naegleria lovaniensis TaxID=51637 RepID=A0AA88G786_NAELO|nr:uncharacterized protein C9374_012318 [Naegleria lovaniensis]KAG2373215.1 hypothetical protein C9374_012318 [Naegleria lovaniensis]